MDQNIFNVLIEEMRDSSSTSFSLICHVINKNHNGDSVTTLNARNVLSYLFQCIIESTSNFQHSNITNKDADTQYLQTLTDIGAESGYHLSESNHFCKDITSE